MLSNYPAIRIAIYVAAIVAQVAAFFVRVYSPDLGEAFSATANFLGALAGVTALSNITPTKNLYTAQDVARHLED